MRLIEQLEATRDETLGFFALDERDLARSYGPGKWSVRFILHHLADSEAVLAERIKRVISEPRQVVWYYDENAWAKALDYEHVPLDLARRVFESVRNASIYHVGQHYERGGHVEFVHNRAGLLTLKDLMEDVASHNEHHLGQIRKALGQ